MIYLLLKFKFYAVVCLRPHSHCSGVVSIRFCCIEATRSHCSVFVQKRKEKPPFLCVHTLPDDKKLAKNIRFCAFNCSVFVKPIFEYWSVFKNLRFCAFILIKCVFKNLRFCGYPLLNAFLENLRFCGVFVEISVNTFTKTEVFLSVFLQKRSSVNDVLKALIQPSCLARVISWSTYVLAIFMAHKNDNNKGQPREYTCKA